MDYRFLGTTGVRVSSLALGTMSFGGDADESESAEIFSAARDRGVNLFDCADVYQKGRSEQILGQLIAPVRNEVVLTSKVFGPVGDGPNDRGSSRYHLRAAVEASLERLRTDRIDLYFLHRFDEHTALEDTLRTLEDLVREGKILYPALSNFAAWQAQRTLGIATQHGWAPPVAVQPMYNLAKRQAEVEILPMAAANGLGVITYSPLGGGLLSGKYGPSRRPDAGRLVDNDMYKARYGDEGYYDVAGRFAELAAEWGYHPVTLAIAWVAAHPSVTAPLIGARNVEQLTPALDAAEIELTAEQREEISRLSPAPPPATDRREDVT
ncbi:MAG: aldo/keto reductase, partial [Spirochaeta sp.]|nr:aldo/keto reductase [Spirochaeta sp.]